MKPDQNGFTSRELLIRAAIIFIPMLVYTPNFVFQLHHAKVMDDRANIQAYYFEQSYEFQQTGVYDWTMIHEPEGPGLTSFQSNGNTIKLKAGKLWISPVYGDINHTGVQGYRFSYRCNKGHAKHTLLLESISFPISESPSYSPFA